MARTHLVCVLSCFVVAAAACGGSEAPPPEVAPAPVAVDHYTGHWRGLAAVTSSLPDAPSQMDVSVTIVNEGQCGSFEYGAMACSGHWICNSSFDSPSMMITENVRYGGERCPNGAQIELRATNDPDTLEMIYRSAGISATGTLSRHDVQY